MKLGEIKFDRCKCCPTCDYFVTAEQFGPLGVPMVVCFSGLASRWKLPRINSTRAVWLVAHDKPGKDRVSVSIPPPLIVFDELLVDGQTVTVGANLWKRVEQISKGKPIYVDCWYET